MAIVKMIDIDISEDDMKLKGLDSASSFNFVPEKNNQKEKTKNYKHMQRIAKSYSKRDHMNFRVNS